MKQNGIVAHFPDERPSLMLPGFPIPDSNNVFYPQTQKSNNSNKNRQKDCLPQSPLPYVIFNLFTAGLASPPPPPLSSSSSRSRAAPPDFFLFLLAVLPPLPPLTLLGADISFALCGPENVGVAAWEGVVWALEGAGESCIHEEKG